MVDAVTEKPHWADLYKEVVTSGLCTGCAGCVVACPHDVLRYDHGGTWRPWKVEADGGPEDCTHGVRGCTMCTRACPRFRSWEAECDTYLFGRERRPEEASGISERMLLARATDPEIAACGQDGGLVSAMLVWALENDVIDAALVSGVERGAGSGAALPMVARSREEVIAAAGSRYTYSANTLAYQEAVDGGAERIAIVGMSCQASLPAVMAARKAGKIARRLALSIGLMCSKTFDEALFGELFEARYGIARDSIKKINIKGVFQLWCDDGSYHEVPLKEGHAFTRAGCLSCPDFAAEHADISAGGIGAFGDWTLTVVRTRRGSELVDAMVTAGAVDTRPASDDPGVLTLLERLSRASRKRWPADADSGPGIYALTAPSP
jgi:coenzyme F420 hydrogenase subunit beta